MPGFVGIPELIMLGLVALLIFGPKRLPEMGRSLGKGLREFKSSVSGDEKHGTVDFDEITRSINSDGTSVAKPSTTPVTSATHVDDVPVDSVPVTTVASSNGAVTVK